MKYWSPLSLPLQNSESLKTYHVCLAPRHPIYGFRQPAAVIKLWITGTGPEVVLACAEVVLASRHAQSCDCTGETAAVPGNPTVLNDSLHLGVDKGDELSLEKVQALEIKACANSRDSQEWRKTEASFLLAPSLQSGENRKYPYSLLQEGCLQACSML